MKRKATPPTERRNIFKELDELLREAGLRACLCFTCKHQPGIVCAMCGCRNEKSYRPGLPAHLL